MVKWHLTVITLDNVESCISKVVNDLQNLNIIASGFDTECTGLNHIHDKPFIYQFGYITETDGYAYAVDIEKDHFAAYEVIDVWHTLVPSTPIYLAHNVKFDLHMMINMGMPYRGKNISDTMFWIRFAGDAVQTDKGGVPLQLKAFAAQYISTAARDSEKKLDEEKTKLVKEYNNKLKKRLGWTIKQVDEFFGDKLNTVEDLPEDKVLAYTKWLYDDLPLYLQKKVIGKVSKDDIRYDKLDRANVMQYALEDIIWLLETYVACKRIVDVRKNSEGLKYEHGNIYPLLAMEREGFKIDYPYLLQCRDTVKVYMRKRRQDLSTLAGRPIKASQSKEIIGILQNRFLINVNTTEGEELSRICSDLKRSGDNPTAVEFIDTLQELRTLEKWYSTYIIRFILNYEEKDGKLYTMIKQVGAVSGRVTSDFQQFPKDPIIDKDGNELFHPRKLVLAQDGDYWGIVYLDYSQIELRLQAMYTILIGHPDTNLCRAYMPYKCHTADGRPYKYDDKWCIAHAYDIEWFYDEEPTKVWTALDVHGATTKIAFNIDEHDSEYHSLRYKGKRVNFAKNYGAQFNKIKTMFPEYDDETIHRIDDAYYLAFPGVKEYHSYCYKTARLQPYMQNLFGVKYYGSNGHNLINMLVQGSGAYLLKMKKMEVYDYMQKVGAKSKFIMEIHDELQFKIHKDDDPAIFFEIQKILQTWDDTLVPIVSDMEITTTTWAEKYEISEVGDFDKAKDSVSRLRSSV